MKIGEESFMLSVPQVGFQKKICLSGQHAGQVRRRGEHSSLKVVDHQHFLLLIPISNGTYFWEFTNEIWVSSQLDTWTIQEWPIMSSGSKGLKTEHMATWRLLFGASENGVPKKYAMEWCNSMCN